MTVLIGRVVGENDDGITLFIPKDIHGEFHLEGGEQFFTLCFVRPDDDGNLAAWIPWEE